MKAWTPFDATYLLARIADLEGRVPDSPVLAQEDALDLIVEAGHSLRRLFNFFELEQKADAESALDIDTLKRAVQLVGQVSPDAFHLPFEGPEAPDVAELKNRLNSFVAGVESPESLPELEVLLRLSLIGDGTFDTLLMGLIERVPEIDVLKEVTLKKVQLLGETERLDLWTQYLKETSQARDPHIAPVPEVVDTDFFSASAAEVPARIAEYLTWVRPQLERRHALNGQTQFPMVQVGLARLLTLSGQGAGLGLTGLERTIVRSLARIAVWWRMHAKTVLLADAFGVSTTGSLLDGREYLHARKLVTELSSTRAALAELRQLIRVAQNLIGPDSPALRSVRTYKLGLESMRPNELEIGKHMHEDRLQRHLCRYLVEREIHASGRIFGNGRSDLHVEDAWDLHIVEAKRFLAAPSDTELNGYATQLLSYLDREPINRRGILAFFNFSRVPISAPFTFLRGRILVLPINLCEESPSERTTSLLIKEGEGDDLMTVVRLGRDG